MKKPLLLPPPDLFSVKATSMNPKTSTTSESWTSRILWNIASKSPSGSQSPWRATLKARCSDSAWIQSMTGSSLLPVELCILHSLARLLHKHCREVILSDSRKVNSLEEHRLQEGWLQACLSTLCRCLAQEGCSTPTWLTNNSGPF